MVTLFQWAFRFVVGAIGLAVLAMIIGYFFATRSLPDYSDARRVAGLKEPIEIVRDTANVPHIFGSQRSDIFFGLGYVHAQDRLWQMILSRRTAQGRLSEVFGPATLETDDFMRRLDLVELSRAALPYQTGEVQDALAAYSDGVNAWLRVIQKEALGRGAPELWFFSPKIAPWTPTDSLSLMRLLALQSTPHLRGEVLRAQASLAVPADRLRDIMPDVPGPARTALRSFAQIFPQVPGLPRSVQTARRFDPVPAAGHEAASNAWAAMPNRAAAGASLLASDPHGGLSAPAPFMLAHLEFTDGGVIGATMPGIPAVLMGRSDSLAWGLTASHLDTLDLYVEQVDAEDPTRYRVADGTKPFRTKAVVIDILDAQPETIELRWTDNGPVIPGQHYELASITPPGHVMSLRWTALDPIDQSMTAALNLMRAKSVKAGRAAVAFYKAPAMAITLADAENVAMQMAGRQPARGPDHVSQGRFPSQGWLPRNHWQGLMPFEANPNVTNPEGGIVASTNNKLSDQAFPNHISHSWGDSHRILRLERLLGERRVHTRDSFIEAQLDTISLPARTLLALMGKELWYDGTPAPEGSIERHRQTALELLANWNGEMGRFQPEPLIMEAWLTHVQSRLTRDELGPLAPKFARPDPLFLERVFRDVDGASAWCDVLQTTPVETCQDIARQALDAALLEQIAIYGDRIDSWQWGQAHEARSDHEAMGTMPFVGWVTNIRQDSSGGNHTLNRGRTAGTSSDRFANVHAATYRQVVDFSDLNSSVYVISTGQSGHPLSRHYDDLAGLWQRGEYLLMSMDADLARAGAVGTTILSPPQ